MKQEMFRDASQPTRQIVQKANATPRNFADMPLAWVRLPSLALAAIGAAGILAAGEFGFASMALAGLVAVIGGARMVAVLVEDFCQPVTRPGPTAFPAVFLFS